MVAGGPDENGGCSARTEHAGRRLPSVQQSPTDFGGPWGMPEQVKSAEMRWSGHYGYCFRDEEAVAWGQSRQPTAGMASAVSPSRRGCRWHGLCRGFGTAGTHSAPPPQPRFGEPFRRSAAARTCPTAPCPTKAGDPWDGLIEHLYVINGTDHPWGNGGGSRRSTRYLHHL